MTYLTHPPPNSESAAAWESGRLILRIFRKQPQCSRVRRQLCYSRDSIRFIASLILADALAYRARFPAGKPRPWFVIVYHLDLRLHRPVPAPSSPVSKGTTHDACAASRIYQESSQSVRLGGSSRSDGGCPVPQHQCMGPRCHDRVRNILRSCCGFSISCPGFLTYETKIQKQKGVVLPYNAQPGPVSPIATPGQKPPIRSPLRLDGLENPNDGPKGTESLHAL